VVTNQNTRHELASEPGVTSVTATQWLRGHTPMARPEPLMVSFRCSPFAIRRSEGNPSGMVLEKLMDPGKNHRLFHV
jgi:hypothetical protein